MSSKGGAGAGVGVGMLRSRWIPLLENEKVSWFLGSWLFGFLVSKFLGFKVSKFHSFKVSMISDHHVMFSGRY